MKFKSILKFFGFYKEPNQEQTYKKHMDELLNERRFSEALELLNNGYVMTSKQKKTSSDTLGRLLSDIREIKLNKNKRPDDIQFTSLVEIVEKSPDYESLLYSITPPDDHMEMLFFSMSFHSHFFFNQGYKALTINPKFADDPKEIPLIISSTSESNNLLKILDIYVAALSNKIDSLHPNKKNNLLIESAFQCIPIEFHAYFLDNEPRLKDYAKGKYFFSIADTLVNILKEKNQYNDTSPNFKVSNDFLKMKDFCINYETQVSEFHNVKRMSHNNIVNQLKNQHKNNLINQDFTIINLSEIYSIPDDINSKVKLIQALYGKLIIEKDLSVEHKHYIEEIPKNILKVLDTYEESKAILGEEADKFLEAINILAENITRLNLDIESSKINNLTINKVNVRKMGS